MTYEKLVEEALTIAKRKLGTGWQRHLATQLGITESAVSHWKAGRRLPTGQQLVQVASVLNLNVKLVKRIKESQDNAPVEEPDGLSADEI